jgi:hypothetical protein
MQDLADMINYTKMGWAGKQSDIHAQCERRGKKDNETSCFCVSVVSRASFNTLWADTRSLASARAALGTNMQHLSQMVNTQRWVGLTSKAKSRRNVNGFQGKKDDETSCFFDLIASGTC